MTTVTSETVVFTIRSGVLGLLLVRRPGNQWTLPGGILRQPNALRATAEDALHEQAGVSDVDLEQLFTFDRGDGVCVAFMALISAGRHALTPGDDLVEVRWFDHDDLPRLDDDTLHTVHFARDRLRAKCAYAPIAAQLLPGTFTLGQLQSVYQAVLDTDLDPRNFRRDVLAAGIVEATGDLRSDGRGRPARMLRWVGGDFAVVPAERRAVRAIARLGAADMTPPGAGEIG